MKGRGAVAGSARALSERSEDIPHRPRERGEGFQVSLAMVVRVAVPTIAIPIPTVMTARL